ncbi:voltage-dependent potassium channel beta subunit [Cyclonatronum proteinivorum]|uniref:Voltage-dependent potassium channel beta subunit n=1 Tax=Cyclonatronum proteinivorum TaxID=1457365 RepID=A0A345UH72_9BACT|nr:aldo/keto reductase [Cyclonatronum proteinivorum]AXI99823.1 voltage-dependent potassium channel beta subunit [Cyclonatronum proteinivorum]
MQYRFLGKSGLKVSALSFGSWVTFGEQVDTGLAYEQMKAAYDAGVNFFDNAEAYENGKSEEIMGQVLRKAGWKRSDLVISTKIFWGGEGPNDTGLSFKHIKEGTEAALKRMQLDYVDLLFCHRPDLHTPMEETVWAMDQMIREGKALYWGTSEWSAEEIRMAYEIARREHLRPPLMEQPQYNMFHRERVEQEYARLYRDIGLGTTIWSPLASGLLTGKYNDGIPEGSRLHLEKYSWLRKALLETEEGRAKLEKVKQLAPLAADLGITLPQMALAWCLKNPDVSTVITGASTVEQVKQNMSAMDAVAKLDDSAMERIEAILSNKPSAAPDWREM